MGNQEMVVSDHAVVNCFRECFFVVRVRELSHLVVNELQVYKESGGPGVSLTIFV